MEKCHWNHHFKVKIFKVMIIFQKMLFNLFFFQINSNNNNYIIKMKYTIIKYGKEERENLLKKDNFRKKCCILTNKN